MSGKHRFATEEIERFSTVDLIAELKRRYQVLSRPERSCVLLGVPYSGATSQVSFLRKEWGLCSINRHDILPRHDTDLNEAVSKLADEIGSFKCRKGFAIERFPETVQEAKLFDDMIRSKHQERADYKVILLDMSHDTEESRELSIKQLTSRATGHLIHEPSGRVYNANVPELSPQAPNVDDISGEPLVCPRVDIPGPRSKIESWWRERESVINDFVGARASRIDASQSRDTVSVEISRILLTPSKSQSENVDRSQVPNQPDS